MLGNTIKDLRIRANRTQQELADYCGVSQRAVSKWEQGIDPQEDVKKKIAEFFNISVSELYNRKSIETKVKDPVKELIDRLINERYITKDYADPDVALLLIDCIQANLKSKEIEQKLNELKKSKQLP